MIVLNDLDDSDAELHEYILTNIIKLAETWSVGRFKQASAEVWEVAQVPIEYDNDVVGYSVIVGMPEYPHGKRIEIIIYPDLSMTAREMS